MKSFILGIIAAIAGLFTCKKIYEKGYNDCAENNKPKKEFHINKKETK